MSDSRDLIRAIMDEDFVSAKELTNSLLFSTVADNIEDVRAEVGQSIYGDIEEAKDYDLDGRFENPKNEVHGSRINAAVKAGRLSPAQAARTKSKGKYGEMLPAKDVKTKG